MSRSKMKRAIKKGFDPIHWLKTRYPKAAKKKRIIKKWAARCGLGLIRNDDGHIIGYNYLENRIFSKQ